MRTLKLVPDTNFFIHFKNMEEIPWKDLLAEKYSQIELLIVPPVLTELDNHKYNEKKKIAERARKITNTLKGYLLSDDVKKTKNGLTISLSNVDYDKDSRNMDDQILSCLINIAVQKNEIEDIIAVSHDTFLQLKFKQSNITYFDLGEEYLLPPEPTKDQKDLLQVRKELSQFKNRRPKLSLKDCNSNKLVRFKFNETAKQDDEAALEKLSIIKSEYPKHSESKPISPSINAMTIAVQGMNGIKEEQWESYDDKLELFYQDYLEYIYKEQEFQSFKSRVLELNLEVENTGTSPANNVDISMHITVPKNVKLLDSYDYEELLESLEPHEPSPPREPQGFAGLFANLHSTTDLMGSLHMPTISPNMIQRDKPNVSSPTITPTNSYNVDLDITSVKHHSKEALKKMFLIFPTSEIKTSFKIEYKLICDELPQPTESIINYINQS